MLRLGSVSQMLLRSWWPLSPLEIIVPQDDDKILHDSYKNSKHSTFTSNNPLHDVFMPAWGFILLWI